MLIIFAFARFSAANTASAAAGINRQINFQGKLVNPDGTNVTNGTYSIVFSIYTVASAGSNIWTETQSPTVTNGIFQVALGSVTSMPGSIDFNTDNIYLGVKVGADAEMAPRIQFTSVAQAFNSEKLGGLDKTGFIQNNTVQQASSNFNISGAGVIGTTLTTPVLQSAAATALTITGNAASTWSTSAGNITLQAGGGTVSLGTTTALTSTNGLTVTGGSTLDLRSTTASAISLDSGTTGQINIGTNSNGKIITIGNNTTTTSLVLTTGTVGIAATSTATTGTALSLTSSSLTTGTALKVTSSNNSASATGWSANQLVVTNAQGTTANTSYGLDVQYNQAPTVAGNTESVANFAIAASAGSPTDSAVNAIINVANNDTATGNQITATNGILLAGANIANGINLSGTFGTNLITSTNFGVTQGGVINSAALTASQVVFTDGSKNLVSTGTSAALLNGLSDETGTGVAVFGTSPSITTSLLTASTSFDLFNTTATTLNIGGAAGAAGLTLAGGSGSTGCTIDGTNGNLACSGNITGGATGTQGYLSRAGTVLQPATAGDSFTTTGNITTSGSGVISSPGSGSLTERFGSGSSTGASINSVAVGNGATGATSAVVVGQAAINNGASSVAIGQAASSDTGGVAIGRSASNGGFSNSIAIGFNATNTAANQVVIGSSATVTSFIFGQSSAPTPGSIVVQGTNSTNSANTGATVNLQGGNGASTGTGSAGGGLNLYGGTAGAGSANNLGGSVAIQGGTSTGTTTGSSVFIIGGTAVGVNQIGGNVTIQGGVPTGTGVSGSVIVKSNTNNTTSAFQIQSATADILFAADTTNNRLIVGNATASAGTDSTLLVLDSATTANKPIGVNGGMYYDTTLNKFQCYQNGAYSNCVYSASSTATARVYNNANESVANGTFTAVTFNSERIDTDTMHSTSTNTDRLTATTAGYYQIGGSLIWDINGTGYRQMSVRVNGATTIAVQDNPISAGGSVTAQTISTSYYLNAGDYVQLWGYQNSGGALNILNSGNNSPEFTMTKLDGGAAAAPQTLQNAYDSSSSPATITSTSNTKDIIFKSGSGLNSASLFQVQNAAGTSVLNVDTINGRVGIANATPGYRLSIVNEGGAVGSSQLHLNNSTADTGAYLLGYTATGISVSILSTGAAYNGTNWIAKGTSASLLGQVSGDLIFYGNTGLTATSSYTPTERLRVASTGLATIAYDVTGTPGSSAGLVVRNTNTGVNSQAELTLDPGGASGSVWTLSAEDTASLFRIFDNTTERFRIDAAGIVTVSSSLTASSFVQGGGGGADEAFRVGDDASICDIDITGVIRIGAYNNCTGSAQLEVALASFGSAALCSTASSKGGASIITDCASAPVADYAEMYPTASGITYGDIVSTGATQVDTYGAGVDGAVDFAKPIGKIAQVVKTSAPYQSNTIGIMSDNHGDFTSTGNNIKPEHNPMPVALNGRVPVNISPDSDPINPGDYLTTSVDSGKAVKATQGGYTVGKALGYWNPDSGETQVIVFVEPGFWPGPTQTSLLQNGASASLQDLSVAGNASIGGTLNVSGAATLSTLTVTGDAVVEGKLTVASIQVGTITVGGHIVTAGDAPLTEVLTAAGLGSAVAIDGNDTAGTVTITTGASGMAAGDLAKINFKNSFGKAPKIVLSAQDDTSINARIFPSSKSSSSYVLKSSQVLAPNTAYIFDYFIVE